MSAALAIVVLVASGDAHEAATSAMVDAAAAVSGRQIALEEVTAPSDAQALALASLDGADVVAVLTWDATRARATIHLHRDADTRWLDRVVAFDSTDAAQERGRTLGFAIASMLPDRAPEVAAPDPAPAPPAAPAPVPAPAPLPARAPAATPRPTRSDPLFRGAIDACGAATFAVGGAGGGIGVTLRAHAYVTPRVSGALSLSLRSGQITGAQATTLDLGASLGLLFDIVAARPGQPLSLGARAGLIATRQSVSHLQTAGAAATERARLVPGAGLRAELAAYFAPSAGFVLAVGPELMFGETRIFIGDRAVASLAPWRLVTEIGVRARF